MLAVAPPTARALIVKRSSIRVTWGRTLTELMARHLSLLDSTGLSEHTGQSQQWSGCPRRAASVANCCWISRSRFWSRCCAALSVCVWFGADAVFGSAVTGCADCCAKRKACPCPQSRAERIAAVLQTLIPKCSFIICVTPTRKEATCMPYVSAANRLPAGTSESARNRDGDWVSIFRHRRQTVRSCASVVDGCPWQSDCNRRVEEVVGT